MPTRYHFMLNLSSPRSHLLFNPIKQMITLTLYDPMEPPLSFFILLICVDIVVLAELLVDVVLSSEAGLIPRSPSMLIHNC